MGKSILRSTRTKSFINPNLTDYRHVIFRFFESRLDTVIHRAHFSLNIRGASQLISHGHVYVNGKPVRIKSYRLRSNDLIEIACNLKSRLLVQKNIDNSNLWPLPPKHL